MSDLFVNNLSGSDSNDGLGPTTAKARLAAALAIAVDGDRIVIEYGTGEYGWEDEVAVGDDGLEVPVRVSIVGARSDDPSDATLSTTKVPTLRGSVVTAAPSPPDSPPDWQQDASDFSSGDVWFTTLPAVNPHAVFDPTIAGLDPRAEEVEDSADLEPGKFWWDPDGERLYYIVSTDTVTSPASYSNPGESSVRVPITRATLVLGAAGITFENIRLSEWGVVGIDAGAHARPKMTNSYFVFGYGPYIDHRGDAPWIERNRSRMTGPRPTNGVLPGSHNGSAVLLTGTRDGVVRNNDIATFAGSAVHLQESEGGNVILENRISDGSFPSDIAAITVSDKAAAEFDYIQRNIIRDHFGRAVQINGGRRVMVYRNVAYDCLAGIDLARGLGDGVPSRCVVAGNILSETSRSWVASALAADADAGLLMNDASVSAHDLDDADRAMLRSSAWVHNIYHRSPDSGTGSESRFRFDDQYGDLAWWMENAGFDAASSESSPGFVDAADGDFHLDPDANAAASVERFASLRVGAALADAHVILESKENAGAFDTPAADFDPRQDLVFILTGNESGQDVNVTPSSSVGGDPSTPDSTVLAGLENLFGAVAGEDLTEGVTHYRAVDLMNIAITPEAEIPVGGGTLLRNFDTGTGVWGDPKVWITEAPRSGQTTLSVGWEERATSPAFQGPLADDQTAPTNVTFETPLDEDAALAAAGTPPVTLPGKLAGSDPTHLRLWLRRTVEAGALTRNHDGGLL
jgi:hypothetical protein